MREDIDLVRVLAPREFRARYRQSVLDVAWALVTPLVVLAVYGYILTQAFDVEAACAPYLTSTWAGLVVWTFFASATGGAVSSLISSANLLSKVAVPVEAIPLSVATSSLVDLAVGLAVLVALVVIQGISVSAVALATALPLVVIVVWTAALSVAVGVAAGFARDVVHALNLALRVGFFATPVMYEASFLPSALRWTESVNPVAAAITGVRDALLCGEGPRWGVLGAHLVVGSLALVMALLWARAVEGRLRDVL